MRKLRLEGTHARIVCVLMHKMELNMILRLALAIMIVALLPLAAKANEPELRQLLQQPGVHAIMRHALAPGTSDPRGFRVDDCSTQRNLDSRGRAQARAIGARLRALGATLNEIRTSQWCRCKDTAELLGLGAPVEDPVLNSFFDDRSTAGAQTDALRAYLRALPSERKVLFVTHQVNISALVGQGTSSGELLLISLDNNGSVQVVGGLEIDP